MPPKPGEGARSAVKRRPSLPNGRPTKDTPRRRKMIRESLLRGMPREPAAARAGIAYNTLNDWLQNKDDFAQMVEAAEAEWQDKSVKILQQISSGEIIAKPDQLRALLFMLERRAHVDWKERSEQTVTGNDGGPLEIIIREVDNWRQVPVVHISEDFEREIEAGEAHPEGIVAALTEGEGDGEH